MGAAEAIGRRRGRAKRRRMAGSSVSRHTFTTNSGFASLLPSPRTTYRTHFPTADFPAFRAISSTYISEFYFGLTPKTEKVERRLCRLSNYPHKKDTSLKIEPRIKRETNILK